MARKADAQALNLWMNGTLVGVWERTPQGERLTYYEEWLNSEYARPISLSMPFTPNNEPYRGAVVTAYFDNLLPDSQGIRQRLAAKFQAESTEPFDMLRALGRDCVGALQLLPTDELPTDLESVSGEVLNEADIARLLRNISSRMPLGRHLDDNDLRLSIAGAQEKTALLYQDGQWLLPHGSTPTTHIMKLPLGLVGNMQADMRMSVENEWLCAQLAEAFGLPVAHSEIGQFEDQKVLIVERFDRRWSSDHSWIIRLPQEDMCQAKGTPPHLKYQTDGGPDVLSISEILSGSAAPQADLDVFFKAQLFFWLLAATDGHAKNFSIFHLPGAAYRLTPLYDILSAHPLIGTGPNQFAMQKIKLAMAVRGRSGNVYLINKIQRRHWNHMSIRVGRGRDAEDMIADLLDHADDALNAVASRLPEGFPEDVAQSILEGVRRQCQRLNSMPAKLAEGVAVR